jgi:hypothetical protein
VRVFRERELLGRDHLDVNPYIRAWGNM